MASGSETAGKRGGGLLFCCADEVLLLLRRSAHNDMAWGLPGGNCEAGDASIQTTAAREATEELGSLPPVTVLSSHLTRRGKRMEKEYTVLVCRVEPAVRAAWRPVLNHEHREWRWFPMHNVRLAASGVSGPPAPLHPVVSALITQHPEAMQEEMVAV